MRRPGEEGESDAVRLKRRQEEAAAGKAGPAVSAYAGLPGPSASSQEAAPSFPASAFAPASLLAAFGALQKPQPDARGAEERERGLSGAISSESESSAQMILTGEKVPASEIFGLLDSHHQKKRKRNDGARKGGADRGDRKERKHEKKVNKSDLKSKKKKKKKQKKGQSKKKRSSSSSSSLSSDDSILSDSDDRGDSTQSDENRGVGLWERQRSASSAGRLLFVEDVRGDSALSEFGRLHAAKIPKFRRLHQVWGNQTGGTSKRAVLEHLEAQMGRTVGRRGRGEAGGDLPRYFSHVKRKREDRDKLEGQEERGEGDTRGDSPKAGDDRGGGAGGSTASVPVAAVSRDFYLRTFNPLAERAMLAKAQKTSEAASKSRKVSGDKKSKGGRRSSAEDKKKQRGDRATGGKAKGAGGEIEGGLDAEARREREKVGKALRDAGLLSGSASVVEVPDDDDMEIEGEGEEGGSGFIALLGEGEGEGDEAGQEGGRTETETLKGDEGFVFRETGAAFREGLKDPSCRRNPQFWLLFIQFHRLAAERGAAMVMEEAKGVMREEGEGRDVWREWRESNEQMSALEGAALREEEQILSEAVAAVRSGGLAGGTGGAGAGGLGGGLLRGLQKAREKDKLHEDDKRAALFLALARLREQGDGDDTVGDLLLSVRALFPFSTEGVKSWIQFVVFSLHEENAATSLPGGAIRTLLQRTVAKPLRVALESEKLLGSRLILDHQRKRGGRLETGLSEVFLRSVMLDLSSGRIDAAVGAVSAQLSLSAVACDAERWEAFSKKWGGNGGHEDVRTVIEWVRARESELGAGDMETFFDSSGESSCASSSSSSTAATSGVVRAVQKLFVTFSKGSNGVGKTVGLPAAAQKAEKAEVPVKKEEMKHSEHDHAGALRECRSPLRRSLESRVDQQQVHGVTGVMEAAELDLETLTLCAFRGHSSGNAPEARHISPESDAAAESLGLCRIPPYVPPPMSPFVFVHHLRGRRLSDAPVVLTLRCLDLLWSFLGTDWDAGGDLFVPGSSFLSRYCSSDPWLQQLQLGVCVEVGGARIDARGAVRFLEEERRRLVETEAGAGFRVDEGITLVEGGGDRGRNGSVMRWVTPNGRVLLPSDPLHLFGVQEADFGERMGERGQNAGMERQRGETGNKEGTVCRRLVELYIALTSARMLHLMGSETKGEGGEGSEASGQRALRLEREGALFLSVALSARSVAVCRELLRHRQSDARLWSLFALVQHRLGKSAEARRTLTAAASAFKDTEEAARIAAFWAHLEIIWWARERTLASSAAAASSASSSSSYSSASPNPSPVDESSSANSSCSFLEGAGLPRASLLIACCLCEGDFSLFAHQFSVGAGGDVGGAVLEPSRTRRLAALRKLRKGLYEEGEKETRVEGDGGGGSFGSVSCWSSDLLSRVFCLLLLSIEIDGPRKAWVAAEPFLKGRVVGGGRGGKLGCVDGEEREREVAWIWTVQALLAHPKSTPGLLREVLTSAVRLFPNNSSLLRLFTEHLSRHNRMTELRGVLTGVVSNNQSSQKETFSSSVSASGGGGGVTERERERNATVLRLKEEMRLMEEGRAVEGEDSDLMCNSENVDLPSEALFHLLQSEFSCGRPSLSRIVHLCEGALERQRSVPLSPFSSSVQKGVPSGERERIWLLYLNAIASGVILRGDPLSLNDAPVTVLFEDAPRPRSWRRRMSDGERRVLSAEEMALESAERLVLLYRKTAARASAHIPFSKQVWVHRLNQLYMERRVENARRDVQRRELDATASAVGGVDSHLFLAVLKEEEETAARWKAADRDLDGRFADTVGEMESSGARSLFDYVLLFA
uniref:Uncharacterized protein n=1 Tax=Chromera velia CCMP2878 TaxID=1169474 RepID=A0A0G4FHM8_9ALVE|eukprot:Cvel_17043.t1-p1 / transcript=Cvel_17043.t1 / gene=Cvel_17043 / organism=Chromera_velia_CCMP2878 / gene_product=hypothetical protein / transcript_product=hypothetical protein / location=Cvel_scaffold1341:32996-44453(-) / protein_length=1821 / sequence_SO=supercontig / SO=protein_coding / is_pseudo=false